MISFNYEIAFQLQAENMIMLWLSEVIRQESCKEGEICYVFCDDSYLHGLNVKFLDHDTLTDVISFDYCVGKELHGDIFISIDRVKENANIFNENFNDELLRVMVHGLLHFCGYKDKTDADAKMMREKENSCLMLLKDIQ
jgi:probable rRNA maturation factor